MQKLRRYYQIFFLLLFAFLFYLTAQNLLKGYQVTFFLDASPFNALCTIITAKTLNYGMWLAIAVLIFTFFFGRIFCGWICPMGTLMHFFSWLNYKFTKKNKSHFEKENTISKFLLLKYFILFILVFLAAFGILQTGIFDPISLLTRTTTIATAKLYSHGEPHVFGFLGAFIVFIFVIIVLLNFVRYRFWCRYICPLGATLGLASYKAVGGIVRDDKKCINCGKCLNACVGACNPHEEPKRSECLTCFNCVNSCKIGALSWSWSSLYKNSTKLDLSKRDCFIGIIGGVGLLATFFAAKNTNARGNAKRIRPPGALQESEFLKRCIKCGACMKICPTNGLQPASVQAGLEGILTPILDMNKGYCELNCTLCGQVCPTGAIQRLSIADKIGYPDGQPKKIGTAFLDRNRCIPWSSNKHCLVCEEVCPVSPKAIYTVPKEVIDGDTTTTYNCPQIDPKRCIGCGLCQHECPLHDMPAIRISAFGEDREGISKQML